MENYFSTDEIKKAIEKVNKQGLSEFMTQSPKNKKQTKPRHSDWQDKEPKVTNKERKHFPRRNFFDQLMFGMPQLLQSHKKQFLQEQMTLAETESEDVCDPCEQVQEIVQGIRAGKYELSPEFFDERTEDTIETSDHYFHRMQTEKPTYEPQHTQQFHNYKVDYEGSNMKALRMRISRD